MLALHTVNGNRFFSSWISFTELNLIWTNWIASMKCKSANSFFFPFRRTESFTSVYLFSIFHFIQRSIQQFYSQQYGNTKLRCTSHTDTKTVTYKHKLDDCKAFIRIVVISSFVHHGVKTNSVQELFVDSFIPSSFNKRIKYVGKIRSCCYNFLARWPFIASRICSRSCSQRFNRCKYSDRMNLLYVRHNLYNIWKLHVMYGFLAGCSKFCAKIHTIFWNISQRIWLTQNIQNW